MIGFEVLVSSALAAEAVKTAPAATDDGLVKYVFYPLVGFLANTLYKTVSDVRTEHLSQVNLVKGLLKEVEVAHESQQPNREAFRAAYAGGAADGFFARKIAEDAGYFPYSIRTRSTTAVFASDDMPMKTFAFLRPETMKRLIDFHDASNMLDASIADMREEVFRELKPDRKMTALHQIVDLFDQASAVHGACHEALLAEDRRLTTTSLSYMLLFPVKSGSWPVMLAIAWIGLNMAWHALRG